MGLFIVIFSETIGHVEHKSNNVWIGLSLIAIRSAV